MKNKNYNHQNRISFEENGLFFTKKTLIILPHLDDEFALAPVLNILSSQPKNNVYFIFCAERRNESIHKQLQRKKECLKSLYLFGYSYHNLIFLNDYFEVIDRKLYKSTLEIYDFLKQFHEKHMFSQILTLSYEGGHPDHDSLALIILSFSKKFSVKPFFFPAYNSRKTFFFPISVLRPLKEHISNFREVKLCLFAWQYSLKIAWVYKSELNAFLKLYPFLIIKNIFDRSIYFSNNIEIEKVNYSESLTLKRYKIRKDSIINEIYKI